MHTGTHTGWGRGQALVSCVDSQSFTCMARQRRSLQDTIIWRLSSASIAIHTAATAALEDRWQLNDLKSSSAADRLTSRSTSFRLAQMLVYFSCRSLSQRWLRSTPVLHGSHSAATVSRHTNARTRGTFACVHAASARQRQNEQVQQSNSVVRQWQHQVTTSRT